MKKHAQLIPVYLIMILTSPSIHGQTPLPLNNPYCPWTNSQWSWRNYIQFAPGASYFSVTLFETSHLQSNPVWKNKCYTVRYDKQQRSWYAHGPFSDRNYQMYESVTDPSGRVTNKWFSKSGKDRSDSEQGSPADPARFEFAIRGIVFVFNEAGEVVHRGDGQVGTMRCYLEHWNDPCKDP